jgi:hypothetical protein
LIRAHANTPQDRHAFVTALIDGDGTIFSSELVNDGERGGREAADQLHASILDYASTNLSHLDSYKIKVKIFANTSSLADTLVKCKEISRSDLFNDFLRGFNSQQPLFDLVDVGSKQGAAADKLEVNLRDCFEDCHCQAVILACSHNDNYTKLVEEVSHESDRLVLLEAVPFSKGMAALQPNFRSVKFDGLFRSTKMVPPAVPTNVILPVLAKVESNRTSGNNSAASTPSMNWATVTAKAAAPVPVITPNIPAPPTTIAKPVQAQRKPSENKTSTKSIFTNRLGQRIDKTDDTIPNYEIQRVKKIKLCNAYYLQDQNCTSSHCTHRHDYPISNSERKTLREVARMTPCYFQTDCEDPECIYGHRCPQSKPGEAGCYYGNDCRFHGWGHGIDTRICKTTKV